MRCTFNTKCKIFLQRFPFKFFTGILCKGVNLLLKSADIKSTKSIFSGAYAMEGIPERKTDVSI